MRLERKSSPIISPEQWLSLARFVAVAAPAASACPSCSTACKESRSATPITGLEHYRLPRYVKFAKLSQQEHKWGLLKDSKAIYDLRGWQQCLADRGAELKSRRGGSHSFSGRALN